MNKRYSAPVPRPVVRVLEGMEACPLDRRLATEEASRQTGISWAAPGTQRTIAVLASHEGEVPLTRGALAYAAGLGQATVSRTVSMLFQAGLVAEGAAKVSGRTQPELTVVPTDLFHEVVEENPEWQAIIAAERAENAAFVAQEHGQG